MDTVHDSPQFEWSKTDIKIADTIISDWSLWMKSNPYDLCDNLMTFWKEAIKFLDEMESRLQ